MRRMRWLALALGLAALLIAALCFTRYRLASLRKARAGAEATLQESIQKNAELQIAAEAAQRAELDSLEKDPGVERSILEGLTIAFEGKPVRSTDGFIELMVSLEKPLGKRYLVDGMDQSCVLFVDARPIGTLPLGETSAERRSLLDSTLGKSSVHFSLPAGISRGALIRIEWRNRNPRSGKEERLSTEEIRLDV